MLNALMWIFVAAFTGMVWLQLARDHQCESTPGYMFGDTFNMNRKGK